MVGIYETQYVDKIWSTTLIPTQILGQNPDLSPIDPENPETEVDQDSISSPPPEGMEQPEAASLPVGSRNRKLDEQTGSEDSSGATALEEDPMPRLHEGIVGAQVMDYGTDALQNEMSNSLYNLNLKRYLWFIWIDKGIKLLEGIFRA